VTFANILVLAILYFIRSRRRRAGVASDSEGDNAKPPTNDATDSGKPAGLEPGEKPELDATTVSKGDGQLMGKQELPASPITTPRPAETAAFELDAGPLLRELPAPEVIVVPTAATRDKPLPVPGGRSVQSTPPPVSPISERSTPRHERVWLAVSDVECWGAGWLFGRGVEGVDTSRLRLAGNSLQGWKNWGPFRGAGRRVIIEQDQPEFLPGFYLSVVNHPVVCSKQI
jgi:hypothetical protein